MWNAKGPGECRLWLAMIYKAEPTKAFAVKWKVEMEALGVQPYLTTYVFLIALAAEAGYSGKPYSRETEQLVKFRDFACSSALYLQLRLIRAMKGSRVEMGAILAGRESCKVGQAVCFVHQGSHALLDGPSCRYPEAENFDTRQVGCCRDRIYFGTTALCHPVSATVDLVLM